MTLFNQLKKKLSKDYKNLWASNRHYKYDNSLQ